MSEESSERHRGAEEVARRAAARLAGEVDPGLPALTERAIAGGGAAEGMRSYDPALAIALGGFLLSVAQLGWTIYRDLKADREKAAEKADRDRAQDRDERRVGLGALLARRIRLGMQMPAGVTPERRDRIVEVVVEEILRGDEGSKAEGAGGWDRKALR
jgi:hypothetical protein